MSRGWPALFLLIVACGGPQSTPDGAVRSFLDALEAGDEATFQGSFTQETRALVAEFETLSAAAEGEQPFDLSEWCQMYCGGVVVGSTLLGDSATVDVRVDAIEERFPLKREGDAWRIDFAARLEPAVQLLKLTAPEGE